MTAECRPPEGTEFGTYWVLWWRDQCPVVMRWEAEGWFRDNGPVLFGSPLSVARWGYICRQRVEFPPNYRKPNP